MDCVQSKVEQLFENPKEFGDDLSPGIAQEALHKIKSSLFGGGISYNDYSSEEEYEEALKAEIEFECGEIGLSEVQSQQILGEL